MKAIKLLWRTDVHLSDRSPASRTDDWIETVFAKLEQVKLVASKVGAHAVLDGGDFFHIKSPSRNSHDLVRRVADHHANYPCPVYCTPGNHDSVYGDYANLDQQPLGVLYSTGVFRRLYDKHEATFEVEGLKVRVVGIPYHGKSYDLERFQSIVKGDEDFLICIAHVLASEKGGTMFEGEDILEYRDLAPLAPDMFMFGHWHKDQGVHEIDGTKFVNIGSLTRGSLSQDNVGRRPAIALLTLSKEEGIRVQVLRLRVKDADEVFDMDARVREEAREMTVDAFVESVREALVETKSASVEESIEGMDGVPDVVRERALGFMEMVQ
jgi:exonuclease SbcC